MQWATRAASRQGDNGGVHVVPAVFQDLLPSGYHPVCICVLSVMTKTPLVAPVILVAPVAVAPTLG